MDEQARKNIHNLTKYPEWLTFETILKTFIDEIGNIDTIGGENIEAEVLGRKIVKDRLLSLLGLVDILKKGGKTIDKTYE